jgi:hypothetical protein
VALPAVVVVLTFGALVVLFGLLQRLTGTAQERSLFRRARAP